MNLFHICFDITKIITLRSARACAVLGIFLFLTSCVSWSAPFVCSRCGQPLQDKYISAGQLHFHSECLVCSYCKKPIKGKFTMSGRDLYHPDCHIQAKNLICDYCNKPLDHNWMDSDGKTYHPDCFTNHVQLRCGICSKPIEGNYISQNGVFHEHCYKETILDRCVICSRPIEGRHVVDPWNNKAHVEHKGNKAEVCGSCGRIMGTKVSKGTFQYNDGRYICGICRETAVINHTPIDQSTSAVLSLLSTVGIMGFPASIPISLVDLDELKHKSGNQYNNSARGFTLSAVKKLNDKQVMSEHTIYILKGLPLAEFKAVLAHELLHVWLIENGIDLSSRETEGFCNLGAMLVDSTEHDAMSRILLSQLETNPDPIYGDGYRLMKKKLDHLGWDGLVRELLNSR